MKKAVLNRLRQEGFLSYLDVHFAWMMKDLAGTDGMEIPLAAALVSSITRQGHVCLDLSRVGELFPGLEGSLDFLPSLEQWRLRLVDSPVVGRPGQFRPLVLDHLDRLFLYRYWDYQEKLAGLILSRIHGPLRTIDRLRFRQALNRYFPDDRTDRLNRQALAAISALGKRFCVICGGPGTGKTRTIVKILALFLELTGCEKDRIALAAPTGKAATRLQEALKAAKQAASGEPGMDAVPDGASTIHRLLGSMPGSPYFRYHAQNRLPLDLVVVDEASMVDMALMSKLIQALPDRGGLILVGDKDQLSSVEAGAVLGDICAGDRVDCFSESFRSRVREITGRQIPDMVSSCEEGISDCIVELRENYRFPSGSGIAAMSRAVCSGDGDLAANILTRGGLEDVGWQVLPRPKDLGSMLERNVLSAIKGQLQSREPAEAFRAFERFRILCALREGPFGVKALNGLIEKILAEQGFIPRGTRWYSGRPLMISRNDYNLRLFNGDVGIALPDPELHGELRVFFSGPGGGFRKFHPIRLPEHETVYAMTVHKSQGSEFENILLVLPDRDSPVLTRELLYTALTRARATVRIWGDQAVFARASSRTTARMSGLRDALGNTGSLKTVPTL